jgi:hypothetical protein
MERSLRHSGRSAGLRPSELLSIWDEHHRPLRRDLKDESYGVELLNAIGRAYQAKSVQHAVSHQTVDKE